ncbi:MAG: type I 3-dehydroquinate dehydratase [Chloroflexi bacterium]|nr:type I 3-dehydroquinate dehydratase [Chloroflexota bacterium]
MSERGGSEGVRARRMIGVSLGARTTAEAEAALREIATVADIAELRLDFMVEYDLRRLLRDRPCPVIVTNRPEREGGRYRGPETERIRPLRAAIDLGADYIDIEHDAVEMIPDRGQTRLIVSFHDFKTMPAHLAAIADDLVSRGADIVKVVGMAHRLRDNQPVIEVLEKATVPTIAIAMGEAGLISRIVALRYDSCFLTYATLGRGERVAPGQLPIAVMREVYQAEKIGPRTRVFGVLGRVSPPTELLAALNRTTRAVGVDGVWVPLVIRGDESVEGLADDLCRLGVDGWIAIEPGSRPNGVSVAVRDLGGGLASARESSLAAAFARVTGRAAALPDFPARF